MTAVYIIGGQDQADNFPVTAACPNFLSINRWATMQPTATGPLLWTPIDNALTEVAKVGGKVAIAVTPGIDAPSWPGAQTVADKDGNLVPVPWDQNYLNAWTAFVMQLSDRYAANPLVDHVVLPVAAYRFPSTSLPVDATALKGWQAVGYTSDALLATIQSWNGTVSRLFQEFVIAPEMDGFPMISGQLSSLATYEAILQQAPMWQGAILEADSGNQRFGIPPAMAAIGVPTILQEAFPQGTLAGVQAFLAQAANCRSAELYPGDAKLLEAT